MSEQLKQLMEPSLSDPCILYLYSLNVMRGRWLEGESYIKTDPEYAFLYAYNIIDGKWEEAEPYIEKDCYWHKVYLDNIVWIDWHITCMIVFTFMMCVLLVLFIGTMIYLGIQ